MNFTFKTIKSTGKFRSFCADMIEIKKNKNLVGCIKSDSQYTLQAPFKIRLMVYKNDIMEDNNLNCEWKWIVLKKEFNSIEETKEFLKNNFELINSKYKFYEIID